MMLNIHHFHGPPRLGLQDELAAVFLLAASNHGVHATPDVVQLEPL